MRLRGERPWRHWTQHSWSMGWPNSISRLALRISSRARKAVFSSMEVVAICCCWSACCCCSGDRGFWSACCCSCCSGVSIVVGVVGLGVGVVVLLVVGVKVSIVKLRLRLGGMGDWGGEGGGDDGGGPEGP